MATAMARTHPLNRLARVTGGFYLAFVLASVLADVLGRIGIGTAEQTYQAITLHLASFRLGLVAAFVSALLFLLAAWGLYLLLRTIDDGLALLFLLLNAVGVAIQGASMLSLVSAMALAPGANAGHLQALSPEEVQGLVYHALDVYKTGFVTAQLFFGTWLFPLGYLVYASRTLPRFLGVLLMIDGVAVLVWFFQAFLLPAHPEIIYPGLVVSFVAEVGLALWLLVRGLTPIGPRAEPAALVRTRQP